MRDKLLFIISLKYMRSLFNCTWNLGRLFGEIHRGQVERMPYRIQEYWLKEVQLCTKMSLKGQRYVNMVLLQLAP